MEHAAPYPIQVSYVLHDLSPGEYGRHLNVWDWTQRKLLQRIDLGPDGYLPLEIRFLHDPTKAEGFTGCALSSTIFYFYKTEVRTSK